MACHKHCFSTVCFLGPWGVCVCVCVCERERERERELAATKILCGSSMEFAVPLPERECKDFSIFDVRLA